jgi:hypothetical protein
MVYNCPCGAVLKSTRDIKRHEISMRHQQAMNTQKNTEEVQDELEDKLEDDSLQNTSVDENENENNEVPQEDLLQDLENDKFIEDEEQKIDEKKNDIIKDRLDQIKLEKQQLQLENLKNKVEKQNKKVEDDQIFDDKGTPIVGKDKRAMIAKIKQYIHLFPQELKGFKIKKNADIKQLQEYLDEIDSILEVQTIEDFCIKPILESIQACEPIVFRFTKLDIRGLAVNLKLNPQFNTLSKKLYVKYGSFIQMPVEYQMILVILTTTMLTIQKNKGRDKFEFYINQPLNQDNNTNV